VTVAAPVGSPRATALTETLLAAPESDMQAEVLGSLRGELVRTLGALVAELPAGERLVLDDHRLRIAVRDPERCADDEPFRPSPRLVRRAVGIAALTRLVRGHASGPGLAVAEVLDEALDDAAAGRGAGPRPPWWSPWYATLAPAARAVVRAEASTWATQVWGALEWDRLRPGPVIGGRDDWWECPGGHGLALRGRADVRVPLAGRQALLVVRGGVASPDWPVDLGFPALVGALVRGERGLPARVVGTWPASGQCRVLEVDGPALAAAADAVVRAVGTWVDARIERGRAGQPQARIS
jgi:hypothetical protein